ncbi:hypothetical protein [Prevotella corporis]|uniref:hypothetical protein n=1 Tax=Prevotella corporis TaxID=28128 RepID=UPI0023652AA4|nr:hypothetical protein [Prevotella corporis]
MADVIPTIITKVLAKIIIYILFTMMFCGVMGELLHYNSFPFSLLKLTFENVIVILLIISHLQ